jgi:cell division protein FtsQ
MPGGFQSTYKRLKYMENMRQKNHNNGFLSGFKKLFIFCLFIIAFAYILFVSFRLKNVTIEGSSHYTAEELQKKVITNKTDSNTILLYLRYQYLKYKYGKIDNIPFVQDIDIELINKNSIKIHVYEKVITGCIEFMGGYMYFDKDGMIAESSDEKLDEIPFVTGLKFKKIVLYQKLEVQKKSLFDTILNITQLIKKYDLKVQTIQFNSDLEVILYCGDIKVLLGKRDTYDEQIAELKNLLPSAKNRKITLDLTDFKEGQDKIIAKPGY